MHREIRSLTRRDSQYIKPSPPSRVLHKQLSMRNSNAPRITTTRNLIYAGQYSIFSMTTSMMRSQMIRRLWGGINRWNQEKCSIKSQPRMANPLQQPYCRTIRFSKACIPRMTPPKYCSGALKIVKLPSIRVCVYFSPSVMPLSWIA